MKDYLAHDTWQRRLRKVARDHPAGPCGRTGVSRKVGGVNREFEREMRDDMADRARQAAVRERRRCPALGPLTG